MSALLAWGHYGAHSPGGEVAILMVAFVLVFGLLLFGRSAK